MTDIQSIVTSVSLAFPHRAQLMIERHPSLAAADLADLHAWRLQLSFGKVPTSQVVVAPASVKPHEASGQAAMVFEWPAQLGPLVAFDLQTAEGMSVDRSEPVASALLGLFPDSDAAFERSFMNQAGRVGDASSQFFVADQIYTHFTGFPGYRAAAAVVAGYKAAESLRPEELQRAGILLDEALSLMTSLVPNQHPRRNPEHLQFSLLTALWHVSLASNDLERTLATLERAYEASQSLTWFATPAYPACRCLLLLGWLQWSQGNLSAARRSWWRVTELFALAVRDADVRRGTIYEELRDVQASAVLAAQGVHQVDGTLPEVMAVTAASIADRALRVGGAAGELIKHRLAHWPHV